MSDEEQAENALSDIEAGRLDAVKKTNEHLFQQGKRFSMSSLKTLGGEMSGAKFEIEGLEEEEKPQRKEQAKSEPAEPESDSRQWTDTTNLLDLVSQWDTVKLSQQRALGALVSLPQSDQSEVEAVLDICTAKSVQQFLLKHWSKLFGEQNEFSISDLSDAVAVDDRKNKHRAYLIWAMCNFDNIREHTQVGNFWETDISKSDIEAMI
jgi:hypothetical protein